MQSKENHSIYPSGMGAETVIQSQFLCQSLPKLQVINLLFTHIHNSLIQNWLALYYGMHKLNICHILKSHFYLSMEIFYYLVKFFPFPRNKEPKKLPLFKWTRVSASELISHWIALEPHSFMIFLRSLFAPENVLPFNKHILEVDTFFSCFYS